MFHTCFQCGRPHHYESRAEELRNGEVVDIIWMCSDPCAELFVRQTPHRTFRVIGRKIQPVKDPEWRPDADFVPDVPMPEK